MIERIHLIFHFMGELSPETADREIKSPWWGLPVDFGAFLTSSK